MINTKKKIISCLVIFVFVILGGLFQTNEAQAGWNYENVGFFAAGSSRAGLSPVYRFYNKKGTDHFYTISSYEKDQIIASNRQDWQYEEIAFYASTTPRSLYHAVYRFYNKNGTDHFYTTSSHEKDQIIASNKHDWKYEGIAFYVPQTSSGNVSTHRFYNKNGTDHFYTVSEHEKNVLTGTATIGSLGPNITVGILSYSKSYSKKHSFRFEANKAYKIKDKNGNVIVAVDGGVTAKVKYVGSGKLRVYGDGFDHTASKTFYFEAADGNNNDIIFNVEPKSFDDYRGEIKVRYSDEDDEVWVINTLPLEQYAWGMGEITGTGSMNYNRVMAMTFRSYGYWKIKYSTKHASKGFKVDTTAGDQIYYGYDWEKDHSRIRRGVEETRGKMVYYDGDVAITPYSSSTDGRTRSWKERWGSSNYPYCKSVADPYGKVAGAGSIAGNHMVGLSAHGAVNLGNNYGWSYTKILKYYYTGIDITQVY